MGHVAEWINKTQDAKKNEFAHFLDTMCVVSPFNALSSSGALFMDLAGTHDTLKVFRSRRAAKALLHADVIMHFTGVENANAMSGDVEYLKNYWEVRIWFWCYCLSIFHTKDHNLLQD